MLVIKALLCLAAAATAASGMPAHQSRSATLRHRSLAHQPGSYAPLLPRSATPELKENTGDSKDGPQAVPSTNTCDASDVLTGPEMYNIHSGPRAGEAQPKATEVEAKGDLCTLPSAPADISKPAASEGKRYIAYSSVYHGVGLGQLPDPSQLEGMTHLILSFVNSTDNFRSYQVSGMADWNANTTEEIRSGHSDLKVMAAFGGWGGDAYFRAKANTTAGRSELAQQFVDFVKEKKLDGLDLDWEFPVGNGDTYLTEPNNPCEKYWMVDLTHKVRQALNALSKETKQEYTLSVAVPGRLVDIQATDAYNVETITEMEKSIDFWNLMTYDMMNRRDLRAVHHAGKQGTEAAVTEYSNRKMTPKMMTVGFPMYAKWFHAPNTQCNAANPIGCKFPLDTFESSKNGSDLGNQGAMIFNDEMNAEKYLGPDSVKLLEGKNLYRSWIAAQAVPVVDEQAGAHSAWDAVNHIFWTWLSVNDVKIGCEAWIEETGGVFIWALNQDRDGTKGGNRTKALAECVAKHQTRPQGAGAAPVNPDDAAADDKPGPVAVSGDAAQSGEASTASAEATSAAAEPSGTDAMQSEASSTATEADSPANASATATDEKAPSPTAGGPSAGDEAPSDAASSTGDSSDAPASSTDTSDAEQTTTV